MKVTKALIGRPVRIVWWDPCSFDNDEIPTGRAALARWEEWGVLAAIEEGVVSFTHGKVNGGSSTAPRYQGSAVPEDLIETVEELVVKEPARG